MSAHNTPPAATMSALLTTRQAEELHKSLIAYLTSLSLPTPTLTALRTDLNLPESTFPPATSQKYSGLLEKKWTSVVRLQKKILELEALNKQLQHDLDTSTPASRTKDLDPNLWLPRAPAQHTLLSHRLPVTALAFHPVYSTLASASEDCTIKLWDHSDGTLEQTLKSHTKPVLDIDFGGPRGNTLLASCSSDLTIKLWDAGDEYKNIRTLAGHDHSISSVRFIPAGAAGSPLSGNLLASASRDKTIRIWDVTTGYCLRTLRGHAEWVRSLAPAMGGRYLLSTSSDQTARLWDLSLPDAAALKQTFTAHDHVVECCAFAPATSYAHLATLAGQKKPPPASSTAEFLATGGRDKLIQLSSVNGVTIKTLSGHDNWVRALAFHPGGKFLLSASDDKTVRCWDLSMEGKCVRVVEAGAHFVSCLRWAPSTWKEEEAKGGGEGEGGWKEGVRALCAAGSVDLGVRVFGS